MGAGAAADDDDPGAAAQQGQRGLGHPPGAVEVGVHHRAAESRSAVEAVSDQSTNVAAFLTSTSSRPGSASTAAMAALFGGGVERRRPHRAPEGAGASWFASAGGEQHQPPLAGQLAGDLVADAQGGPVTSAPLGPSPRPLRWVFHHGGGVAEACPGVAPRGPRRAASGRPSRWRHTDGIVKTVVFGAIPPSAASQPPPWHDRRTTPRNVRNGQCPPSLYYRNPAEEQVKTPVIENRAPSVGHLFRNRVEESGPPRPTGSPAGDQWECVTWSDVREAAYRLAAGLIALGIGPEDRVAVARPPATSGCSPTSVHVRRRGHHDDLPHHHATDVSYILSNSGAGSSSPRTTHRSQAARAPVADIPQVTRIVTFDGSADGDWVISLSSLEQLRRRAAGHQLRVPSTSGSTRSPPNGWPRSSTPRARPAVPRACAHARRLDLRGRRGRRDRHPAPRRPAVPVAAAGPRLRQGAAHAAAADRLPHRDRRPHRQDRRQPGRGEAHVHGRRGRASSRRPTAATR